MKISIITVCLNAEETIERTMQSVFSQTYEDIEYIIIDGGSTDGTLDIVHRHKDRLVRVISEKDDGIYDAMNKGIAASTGDVLYFLNASDRLYDENVITRVVREFERADAMVVYGKSLYENVPLGLERRYACPAPVFLCKMDVAKSTSPQQCFFYKKEAFNKIGMFETRFRIAADMDWFLRSMTRQVKNRYIDLNVCICDLSGVSSSSHVRERVEVFWKNMNMAEFFCYAGFALSRQCRRLLRRERLN